MQCVLDKPVNDRRETVKLKVQDTPLCATQNLGRIGRPS